MSESRDYILDLRSAAPPADTPEAASAPRNTPDPPRPWLAVHWRCCHVYSRIYRNREQTAYIGRCPSCGRSVRAAIGAGGVSNRFFQAG